MTQRVEIFDEVKKTYVYPDVVRIYFKYELEQWELDTLEGLCGNFYYRHINMRDKRFKTIDQQMFARGFRQSLNLTQPTEDAFKFLISRLVDSSKYTITYIEIAIDWIMSNRKKAMSLHQFIENGLRKSYHRKEHPVKRLYSLTTKHGLIEEHLTTNIGARKMGHNFQYILGCQAGTL